MTPAARLDTGDTAWLLVSAALVLLMTPGLAFFYGGMVRAKSVLNMLMMSLASIGVVSLLWVMFGFSVAFGSGAGRWSGLWGGLGWVGMSGLATQSTVNGAAYPVPVLAFAAFQLMFAVITPALVSGAIADRARFGAWMAFVALWVSLCYFPVAHWVFDFGDAHGNGAGWLAGWACWTSPAGPPCTSTPGPLAWRWRWCWAGGSAGAASRCGRTTCRW